LLGGRDLVLLPTLYAVRLDRVSDRTHSAGVQNCRDWSVVSSCSADSVETRADQAGQLTGMAVYPQSAGANQLAILTLEPVVRKNSIWTVHLCAQQRFQAGNEAKMFILFPVYVNWRAVAGARNNLRNGI